VAAEEMTALMTEPQGKPAAGADTPVLLDVQGLTVQYRMRGAWVDVVQDLSFTLPAGRTVGLVGESGCGKSTTALAVMDLLPRSGSRVSGGSVRINGRDLYRLPQGERRRMRGRDMAMIFQEPMASLNPAFTVGEQIAEAVRVHLGASRKEAWRRAVECMEMVEIPDAARRAKDYPFSFSGGQLQRVMIAGALSCGPRLLIADEPTTALDVTIQAQVLSLLERLQAELDMGILFITHDLAVMGDICDDVVVMYAGQAVESAEVPSFLAGPRHPYARGLMSAMPQFVSGRERLSVIPGRVPAPGSAPAGCRFNPRCAYREQECVELEPAMRVSSPGHADRCLRSDEIAAATEFPAFTKDVS
jgi:peptide/nickel transport system ATP-binding protein